MLKSLIAAMALASLSVTGFAGRANADSEVCALPVSAKSDCNRAVTWPSPHRPYPNDE